MRPIRIVLEDDVALRPLQVILDPDCPEERRAAFADYVRHDVPDFGLWCDALRAEVRGLHPAEVTLVADPASLEAALPGADVAVVESLPITANSLDRAPGLRLVYKFGTVLSNIDLDACRGRNLVVKALRRRTNIAVAEHSFALILTLAKRLDHVAGLVTPERFAALGSPLTPFDRRHTPNANWGRVPGLRRLRGSVLGLLGLGEIGREMALIAQGFGMRTVYHQRQRLPEGLEAELQVSYCSFEELFATSDTVSVHIPFNAGTKGLVGRNAIGMMKHGALLVNTARAEIVDRQALEAGLISGPLAGAGFDVLYEEPAAEDDLLLALDNFVATPHLAGGSRLNGLDDMREMITSIHTLLTAHAGDD